MSRCLCHRAQSRPRSVGCMFEQPAHADLLQGSVAVRLRVDERQSYAPRPLQIGTQRKTGAQRGARASSFLSN